MLLCDKCDVEYDPIDIEQSARVKYPGLCIDCIFRVVDDIASSDIPYYPSNEWNQEFNQGPRLVFRRIDTLDSDTDE